jgi:hypothetical protein
MTSVLGNQHSIPDPDAVSTRPDPGPVFPGSPTACGVLDPEQVSLWETDGGRTRELTNPGRA